MVTTCLNRDVYTNNGKRLKGYKHSIESRINMRNGAIRRLKRDINIKFHPNYNPRGCKYFEQLMLETNTHIQHALNGGEFKVPHTRYWVDGYDKENNIVYEYDEVTHFKKDGTLCDRDTQRQKEIEDILQCKFIRIRDLKKIKNVI